jgi:hypothetical protein
MNWRNKIETDLNEVLQTHTVFMNVSKGVVASKQDLLAHFNTEDHKTAALVVLDKGEFEVSDMERALQYETLFRDVAATIADKCVNPNSHRPYPVSLVERALREVHFAVLPTKSAKAQALKGIAALKGYMPIERARMKVRVTVPAAEEKEGGGSAAAAAAAASAASVVPGPVREWLAGMHAVIEYEGAGTLAGTAAVEAVVDPGYFRRLEEEAKARFGGYDGALASVEVLSLSVVSSGSGKGAGGAGVGGEDEEDEEDEDGEGGTAGAGAGGGTTVLLGSAAAAAVSGIAASTLAAARGLDAAATDAAARGTGMAVRRVTQPGRRLACSACAAEFAGPEEHREHHRGEWHRFNLKRKVKAMEPVTEGAFNAMPAKERDAFLNADM